MHSCKLENRTLWKDGISSYGDKLLEEAVYALHRGDIETIFAETESEDVKRFNRLATKKIEIREPESVQDPVPQWPSYIDDINPYEYVADKHMRLIEERGYADNSDEYHTRAARIAQELELFEQKGLLPVLKTCIFIVNRLTSKNAVWGVGRGSSVASYVLYVIGVHDVDSVSYNLDIEEFLGESND